MPKPEYSLDLLLAEIEQRHPHMPEFYQSITEVGEDVLSSAEAADLEQVWHSLRYLAEPDQVIHFRVNWQDDKNRHRVNHGCRVQFNNALGPYKGGLRFSETASASVFHFLGFEQTFKNSLTGLPMGGAKGGADFNPRDKSEGEIRRFCEAFMTQLARYIGPDIDIPAGDIGVGTREIAYMFNQYRTITGKFSGILTGKHPVFGGSCFREEATGYGCVYFAEHVLNHNDSSLEDKRCAVSGAGNVALHTAEKLIERGAKVISLSSRAGAAHFPHGLSSDCLNELKHHQSQRGNLTNFMQQNKLEFYKDIKPWCLEPQLAFPCATENELIEEDAKELVQANCEAVFEGANMPCSKEALQCFSQAGVIVAPSKAVNAGGVAVSGLEITQNRSRTRWEAERVDETLRSIMKNIHDACVEYGTDKDGIDYKKGANIAAFKELSNAVQLYGLA
jgi:glutamate dehydrogenase (NADP+)